MTPAAAALAARLPVAETWFRARPAGPRVTLIDEPHVDVLLRANLWLVEGEERDMLLDSGMGIAPLKPFVDGLRADASKPLAHVLSHAHVDHMGGSWEFGQRLIHPAEAEDLAQGSSRNSLLRESFSESSLNLFAESGYPPLPELLIEALPEPGWNPDAWTLKGAPATMLIEEGDLIDLGGPCYRVLHLPGHSAGGIGLLDDDSGVFFTGDAIYDGPLIVEDREVYAQTLRRLRDLDFSIAHGGHDASFKPARMVEICDSYLRDWGL